MRDCKYGTVKRFGRTMVKLECGSCGDVFEKERRNTHFTKGGKTTYCSKVCSGKALKESTVLKEYRQEFERSLVWSVDKTLGYVYTLNSLHPNADVNGKIYKHVYVMSLHIGRVLVSGEVVHHIDRNRANNSIENLQLMTRSDHANLHAMEDSKFVEEFSDCTVCGKTVGHSSKLQRVYCSIPCRQKGVRQFSIGSDQLQVLLWCVPTTKIAEYLGVSDTAISKRSKLFGLCKPKRGYWAKVNAKK